MENISLFCGATLILVWPLSGTIALRNFALGIGSLACLIWIRFARPKITLQMAFPILLLLAVPAWLWAHYFFLPTDVAAQLYDLKGTWFRVILAVILGATLGLITVRRPKIVIWIWLGMIALALLTAADYIFEVVNTKQLAISDFRFPFKYKSAVVYFLMYPCLLAYSILHFCMLDREPGTLPLRSKLNLGLAAGLLVAICWIDFIAAQALNGVLVAGFMGMILVIVYLKHFFTSPGHKTFPNLVLLIFVVALLCVPLKIFWEYDKKYEKKLGNLIADVEIGIQIDRYTQWRKDPIYKDPYPSRDFSGVSVHGSTYERAAWFVRGAQLLAENPLGAGFSHLAFRYYMLQEKPDLDLHKTHSGWLDYALGLGLPGLFFTWLAMAVIGWRSLHAILAKGVQIPSSIISIATIWILGGIWLLWWPTEVSEREFIEYLFFVVSFFGTADSPRGPGKINLVSKN